MKHTMACTEDIKMPAAVTGPAVSAGRSVSAAVPEGAGFGKQPFNSQCWLVTKLLSNLNS